MYFFSPMQVLVTCPFGLSSLLSKEIKKLSRPELSGTFNILQTLDTAVIVDTDWTGIYQLNLRSRIANKVFLIMGESEVQTFDQLFAVVASLPWNDYLTSSHLSLQVTTKNSQLSSERTIQSVAHKAILSTTPPALRATSPDREENSKTANEFQNTVYPPDRGDTAKPRGVVQIFLHLENNHLKICLNTSGPSLHQRGWRKQT
jgi:putative N6-adenine-specific DNA methylase